MDRDWEACFGLTAPPSLALAAQLHMDTYGTTEAQLAAVAVKNHTHSRNNPHVHFQRGVTLDEVVCSRMIAAPLRLFMCPPITDDAAAAMLASEECARDLTDTPVFIIGTGQAVHGFSIAGLYSDYASWPARPRIAWPTFGPTTWTLPKSTTVSRLRR